MKINSPGLDKVSLSQIPGLQHTFKIYTKKKCRGSKLNRKMNARKLPWRNGTLAGRGEEAGSGGWRESQAQFGVGQGVDKQLAKPWLSKPHGQPCHSGIAASGESKNKNKINPVERDCKSLDRNVLLGFRSAEAPPPHTHTHPGQGKSEWPQLCGRRKTFAPSASGMRIGRALEL